MRRRRGVWFTVAIAGVGVAATLFLVACGDQPVSVDGSLSEASKFDVGSWDASNDVQPDWWNGCPDIPVVCPDADYLVTINGDGPPQVLRSNDSLAKWGAPIVPIYVFRPGGGQAPPERTVLASETPDGGSAIVISLDLNTCYDDRDGGLYGGGTRYCSALADARAGVTLTHEDPPGGIVTGTYSVLANGWANGGPTGKTLFLSGSFTACHICDLPPIP